MLAPSQIIKIILLLIQIPFFIRVDKKRKSALDNLGFQTYKRRSFIVLKKLYRFKSIGKSPFFYSTKDYKVGEYKEHKIGLFNYYSGFSSNQDNSTVVIISMSNKLPKFLLRPKSFTYSFMRWFSKKQEIHTNLQRFSKTKVLLAKEKDKFEVATNFNFNVLSYFASLGDFWVESDGYNLLVYQEGQILFDGDKLEGILDRAIEIKNMLGAGSYEIRNE